MKQIIITFNFLIVATLLSLTVLSLSVTAHSGRTDSNGGHRDNRNVSGLGSYHYHCGGNPAHLHPGGVCPYNSAGSTTSRSTTRRDTISINNKPSTMYVGDNIILSWSVDSDNIISSVNWSSSDSSVVAVNNGELIAHANGTATITATTRNGEASFRIVVRSILVQTITLTNIPERLEVGNFHQTSANIKPSNATDRTIFWSSSDELVATVSTQGLVHAKASGTVTITATSVGGAASSFNLEVFEIFPERIIITNTQIELPLYTSDTINATVLPADTTNPELDWFSNNEGIVSVVNGTITGKAVGQTIITVKCQDIETTVVVNVYEVKPTSITVSRNSLQMQLHEDYTIVASVLPNNVTYPDLVWISSNHEIIKVDDSGVLTPVDIGEAIITVKCDDVAVDIPVEVYIEATSIHFDEYIFTKSVRRGDEVPLYIYFEPLKAKFSDYTINSSDESVAFISDNILYTVGTGTVTLTATSGLLSCSVDIEIRSSVMSIIIWIISIFLVIVGCTVYAIIVLSRKRSQQ
ncbi:MAG: Ig-like domain-containing protein [Oscillospiraceae bacterium]|nr:Ig-like domain-containing protein [Oscillospiraceae bacterium]